MLSPYLFLVHVIKKKFGDMCDGPITLGMMLEDCFETCHCLSKGAISSSTAPQRWKNYNKMSLALRRRSREEQVLKGQPGVHEKREKKAHERWRQQVPARVAVLERATAATEYLSWCFASGAGSPSAAPAGWKGYLAEYLPYVDQPAPGTFAYTCPGAPLLQSGSFASPIWALDGADEADAEGEQEEEREGEGEQVEQRETHAEPHERRETPEEEAAARGEEPTDVVGACARQQRTGLNGEEHEYEMTEEAALEAALEHTVEGPAREAAAPENTNGDPEGDEDAACPAAITPEGVLTLACKAGPAGRARVALMGLTKQQLKKIGGRQGVRVKGLTDLTKKVKGETISTGKAKLVSRMLEMMGKDDVEALRIGDWADWARGRIKQLQNK